MSRRLVLGGLAPLVFTVFFLGQFGCEGDHGEGPAECLGVHEEETFTCGEQCRRRDLNCEVCAGEDSAVGYRYGLGDYRCTSLEDPPNELILACDEVIALPQSGGDPLQLQYAGCCCE